MKKKVVVLGSTGSIGRATLEIIAQEKDSLEISGLACKGSIDLLNMQIETFRPQYVCLYDENRKDSVNPAGARVLTGLEGMKEMVGTDCDIVVNALPGSIGLEPTITALKKGKTLALANKESLVMAGRIIKKLVKDAPERLIPVDSEHSALHQLLQAFPRSELKSMTITASGGPFRNHTSESLEKVSLEEALNHPTWKMGQKITLDSATLMNKGLEVIEAHWLFDIEPSRIKVLVHPESIIHGIVELADNSQLAYMSCPDMKIPIAYALNGSTRLPVAVKSLDLAQTTSLTFYPPDLEKFPSLQLAYNALAAGDSALIVFNTANEVAAEAFIAGRIPFTHIPRVVEDALNHHPRQAVIEDLSAIREIYDWTKTYTEHKLNKTYMR